MPQPAPDADLLVLAGDLDSRLQAFDLFAGWPVPVIYVPGNHEFDDRDVDAALAELRAHCARVGFTMLHRETTIVEMRGRRVRFAGTIGWSDFDLRGTADRARCMRAAQFFLEKIQRSTRDGRVFDAEQVRTEALRDLAWLTDALSQPRRGADWDETVVVTHFAPAPESADPRYGLQPSSASFCNDHRHLMGRAGLWIHGHVHCTHDYLLAGTRVRCNARGHLEKGETERFEPMCVVHA